MRWHFSTGMAVVDARDDFVRARRAHHLARLGRWLSGRRGAGTPRSATGPVVGLGEARLMVIRLSEIVGTVEPTTSFDAHFRPATHRVQARWERIALAHRSGVPLAPITVVRRPDGLYVLDGRHRVSVARAQGHRDIDAWVHAERTTCFASQRACKSSA